ncbi:MAG: hypothetical protein Kow0042_09510 [Calditrichia bacterium]
MENNHNKIVNSREGKERKKYNVAILGINYIGLYIYNHRNGLANTRNNIVGFICTNSKSNENVWLSEGKVLGDISQLDQITKKHKIQKVLIAIDRFDLSPIHEAIRYCKKFNVDYDIVQPFYDINFGINLKNIFRNSIRFQKVTLRRILDIIVGYLLAILFAPICLLISLSIKVESPGSIFYSQERVGENGKLFRLYKFRTMRCNLNSKENHQGLEKFIDEPQLTKVGAFLKRTALENLPCIFNLVNGDLSVIGPAPESPYFVKKYESDVPFYRNRLKVKPGLLGLAQVETAFDDNIENVRQKLKYDLYYVDHHKSPILNLKIILKSLWVLSGFGRIRYFQF